MKNWESQIADRIERHRDTYKPQRIEDPGKRNHACATMKWRREHSEQYQATQKQWREANPDKIKAYQERNKKNIKRWAQEHPDRVRELGRKSDRKRAKSEKRKAWTKEYLKREDVIERRREQDRKRNQSPERIAWRKAYEERRRKDPARIAYRREYNRRYYELKKQEKYK